MYENIKPSLDKINDVLQRKRVNQNISLKEIEERTINRGLKISAETIEKIELGHIIPKIDQLIILLSALGIELEIDSLTIK